MIEVRQSAGDFLKVMILDERGLTQKWLAEEIGCAERKISEKAISPFNESAR